MSQELATAMIAVATSNHSFHIGPWIVLPLLFLAVVIATPIYVMRDRRKRRSGREAGGE